MTGPNLRPSPRPTKEGADINSYCLFCRTGSEKALVQAVQQSFPEIVALAPVKLLPEKRQQTWTDREVTLLPGYVFLFSESDLPGELRHKVQDLYKVLEYEYGERSLHGNDADYADWMLRHSGRIEPSRVLTVGGSVQVIDGPLKDSTGHIIRLDKHKRRAWVEFTFDGQKRIVSLGAIWLETLAPDGVSTAFQAESPQADPTTPQTDTRTPQADQAEPQADLPAESAPAE